MTIEKNPSGEGKDMAIAWRKIDRYASLRRFLLLLATTLQSGTEAQCHGRTYDRHRFGNVLGRGGADGHAATRSARSQIRSCNALVTNAEVAQIEAGNRAGEVQCCGEAAGLSRQNAATIACTLAALAVAAVREANVDRPKLVGIRTIQNGIAEESAYARTRQGFAQIESQAGSPGGDSAIGNVAQIDIPNSAGTGKARQGEDCFRLQTLDILGGDITIEIDLEGFANVFAGDSGDATTIERKRRSRRSASQESETQSGNSR